jgi:hypothetical protein
LHRGPKIARLLVVASHGAIAWFALTVAHLTPSPMRDTWVACGAAFWLVVNPAGTSLLNLAFTPGQDAQLARLAAVLLAGATPMPALAVSIA